jgi:2-polyprenyl-6-methoxyphenol hydroxylase-like FAD-dependent oxidoreductase
MVSQRVEDRIVIAGGGIAGLALARALHARGVPYLVIERSAQAGDGGLAVNLPGNAVQALGQLGLGAQIAAQGHAFHRREYRSGRDRLLLASPQGLFARQRFYGHKGNEGVTGRTICSDQSEFDPAPYDSCRALKGFDGDIAISGIKHAVNLGSAGVH